MGLDNSNFEKMARSFPRGFKTRINPIIYAGNLGIQTVMIGAIVGIPTYFLWSSWRIHSPYTYTKVLSHHN
jgi:hypothetical protein